jgi:uncharacterized BrkB/YihY/UPF0761 family membrane protein
MWTTNQLSKEQLTISNESTNQMQQLITGLLFVVYIPFNMFRASLCSSSGAYQLQQQHPLVYRRNVVVAVLLAVVGLAGKYNSLYLAFSLTFWHRSFTFKF